MKPATSIYCGDAGLFASSPSAPLSRTLALSLDIMYPEQLDITAALTTELRPTPLLHRLEPHWHRYHEAFLSPS